MLYSKSMNLNVNLIHESLSEPSRILLYQIAGLCSSDTLTHNMNHHNLPGEILYSLTFPLYEFSYLSSTRCVVCVCM